MKSTKGLTTMKIPPAPRIKPHQEVRVVIHKNLHVLVKELADRYGLTINNILWDAVTMFWVSNRHSEKELIDILTEDVGPAKT